MVASLALPNNDLIFVGEREPSKMIISDSMLKRLRDSDFKDVKLEARPGRKLAEAYKEVRTGTVSVIR